MSRPAWRLALLAAACAALWALHLKVGFAGYFGDSLWHLDPARSIARGEGLRTKVLWAAQLADFPEGTRPPVKPLFHGPVALLALGYSYKLFGLVDWAPLFCSFFFCLLSGLIAYRLGRDVVGERGGLLAAGLFWTNMVVFDRHANAPTDPAFTLLIVVAFACLWESAKGGARVLCWAAAAGFCLGLASGTRLAGQSYWLGFFAAAFWLHRGAWRPAAALACGLAAPMSALAAYNYAAAGKLFYSPGFYLLYWSKTFPGARAVTSFMGLTTAEAFLNYPADIMQKALTGPFYAASRFLETARAPYAMALVVLGLLFDWRKTPALHRLRGAVALLLLPVLAVNIVVSYGAVHYLEPLFPLFMILAAAAFWRISDEHGAGFGRWRPAAALLCAFLLLGPTILAAKDAWKARPALEAWRAAHEGFGAFVADFVKPGEIVFSDDPTAVAWYADRAAVSLTATKEDAERAFKSLPPDALAITSSRIDSGDYDAFWAEPLKRPGAGVLGYESCARFGSGRFSAVLLRRRGDCPRRR